MRENLLRYIVCPQCCGKLELKNQLERNGEIVSGKLICDKLHKFNITKGIPRLLIYDRRTKSQTTRAFSQKWLRFGGATFSKQWIRFQYKWYLDRFWAKNESKFMKFLRARKYVLDAGTGMGHSAKWFSANPETQVFAIDLSDGIDIAYKNYGKKENIHFLQADLTRLPFKKEMFDFISSDQVLHHTVNTERSFKYLTKFLNKDGMIGIYVYKKKAPIREFSDDYIRSKVTEMPFNEVVKVSRAITLLAMNLAKLNAKITVPEDIPILGIRKGRYDLQRFIYYNMLKCFWSGDSNFDVSLAVNFDWYYPKYAYRHEPEEVRKWFRDQKLKVLRFDVIGSGISAMGKRA